MAFHRIVAVIAGYILPVICTAQRDIPAAYNSSIKVNYVRSWEAFAPITSADTLLARPLKDVRQTTAYIDGIGRPYQTVIKKGVYPTGGMPVDMINMIEYDAFGREQFKYSASPATTAESNPSLSDGYLKLNPFMQQAAFMNDQYGSQGESFFYGQTVLETSPLGRTTKTLAPGNNWVGAGRGVELK